MGNWWEREAVVTATPRPSTTGSNPTSTNSTSNSEGSTHEYEYSIYGFRTQDPKQAADALRCVKIAKMRGSSVRDAIQTRFHDFSHTIWTEILEEIEVGRSLLAGGGGSSPQCRALIDACTAFRNDEWMSETWQNGEARLMI